MSTKTITISRLRDNLAAAFNEISKEDVLIVTRRGKTEHAIVDLDKFEDLLASSDPQYLKTIQKAREEYRKGEVLRFDEAFGNV